MIKICLKSLSVTAKVFEILLTRHFLFIFLEKSKDVEGWGNLTPSLTAVCSPFLMWMP